MNGNERYVECVWWGGEEGEGEENGRGGRGVVWGRGGGGGGGGGGVGVVVRWCVVYRQDILV